MIDYSLLLLDLQDCKDICISVQLAVKCRDSIYTHHSPLIADSIQKNTAQPLILTSVKYQTSYISFFSRVFTMFKTLA